MNLRFFEKIDKIDEIIKKNPLSININKELLYLISDDV